MEVQASSTIIVAEKSKSKKKKKKTGKKVLSEAFGEDTLGENDDLTPAPSDSVQLTPPPADYSSMLLTSGSIQPTPPPLDQPTPPPQDVFDKSSPKLPKTFKCHKTKGTI